MKSVYIGTNIPSKDHRDLKVLAAMEGESVSSLLKRLAMDFVVGNTTKKNNQRIALKFKKN